VKRLLLLSIGFCLSFPGVAFGQTGRISGIARDTLGQRIPDVGILVMPGERNTRTDASGMFRVDSLAAGTYTVRVRRLGYMPMQVTVKLDSSTTRTLELAMMPRPRVLDTVTVTADGHCPRNTFDGFLCRRKTMPGIFLNEEDILAKNATYLADIFHDMEGFRVEPVMTPYGFGRAVRVAQSRCVATLLNGRTFVGAETGASESDFYKPEDLIGVEIYPPGTNSPPEYGHITVGTGISGGVGSAPGSKLPARVSRVGRPTDRCVLINYWTAAAIRRPRRP
jgi:hypothetical protein